MRAGASRYTQPAIPTTPSDRQAQDTHGVSGDADSDVEMRILASTIADEGTNAVGQPNKLWSSRNEVQATAAAGAASTAQSSFNPAGPPIAMLVDSVQRIAGSSRSAAGSSAPVLHQQLPATPAGPARKKTKIAASALPLTLTKGRGQRAVEEQVRALEGLDAEVAGVYANLSQDVSLPRIEEAEAKMINWVAALPLISSRNQSVVTIKSTIMVRMNDVKILCDEGRKKFPRQRECIKYDSSAFACSTLHGVFLLKRHTGHLFQRPIESRGLVAQVCAFLVVVCYVVMGIGRRATGFIIQILDIIIFYALRMDVSGTHPDFNDLPRSVDDVLRGFNLDGRCVTYAVCKACHCTYKPTFALAS